MKSLAVCWLVAVAALAGPAAAEPVPPKDFTLTAAESAALAQAVERGRLLYEFDQAAWVSTDEMVANPAVAPEGEVAISGGWIVEQGEEPGHFVVTYFVDKGQGHAPIYVVPVVNGKARPGQLVANAGRPWTPLQKRMVDARTAAIGIAERPCTPGSFNTVVVPPGSGDEAVQVYLLSAVAPGPEYPFGGHYLAEVTDEGGLIYEPFTKACLNVDPATVPADATAGVSEMLSATPTEIHVFMSLLMGKTVMVITTQNDRMWRVAGDRIDEVRAVKQTR